ncbi:hypothetical protein KCP74_02120 [Salmonella enterica subsp. enterica]|nr:hypothetical protein KCP74_02120 [Salmonella enterica subsp. enterica]
MDPEPTSPRWRCRTGGLPLLSYRCGTDDTITSLFYLNAHRAGLLPRLKDFLRRDFGAEGLPMLKRYPPAFC